jgi:hypothetical protein
MFPNRVLFHDGQMYWLEVLSESGVVWVMNRSCATGRIDSAGAFLERKIAMSGRNGKKVAPKSIAEQLLSRQKNQAGNLTEAYDEDFVALTPNVHELLTRSLVDEKKTMEPATILMFARSGSWTMCLSHKGLKLKWWGEGGTVKQAMMALERACGKEMGQETPEGSEANTGQP